MKQRFRLAVAALVVAACSIASFAAGDASVANWRFGKLTITQLKNGVWLYCSVRNKGGKSAEDVAIYALPADPKLKAPRPADEPVVDLTSRTRDKVSVVFEGALELPAELKTADEFRLLLVVGGTVSDMMPVVAGEPLPKRADRAGFQR